MKKPAAPNREDRLAEALRANLRRRKATTPKKIVAVNGSGAPEPSDSSAA